MALDLNDIRGQIDSIDTDLVALLEQRMTLVDQVVAFKKENKIPVLDSQREAAVLDKVAGLVEKDCYRHAILASFADIMSQSRNYQEGKLTDED